MRFVRRFIMRYWQKRCLKDTAVFGVILAFIVILLLVFGGCKGQIGRKAEMGAKVVDISKDLIGSPGSDIINVEVGAGIIGAIIVGAMFIQTVRALLKHKKMATVLSAAVEASPSDKEVRKAIPKEAAKRGLSEVDVERFRKKVGTESKKEK